MVWIKIISGSWVEANKPVHIFPRASSCRNSVFAFGLFERKANLLNERSISLILSHFSQLTQRTEGNLSLAEKRPIVVEVLYRATDFKSTAAIFIGDLPDDRILRVVGD